MMEKIEGVKHYKEDENRPPFMLRQSGTSNFVTKITTSYYIRFGNPPESVTFGEGWSHPGIVYFKSIKKAIEAAKQVYRIEGLHITVESKIP